MIPYLRAHAAYHRHGTPYIPWIDVLDFHLQHGVVISDRDIFLLARRIAPDLPDHQHATLTLPPASDSHHWHIWIFSGSLAIVLAIAASHGARLATYHRLGRNDDRLHRLSLRDSISCIR